jgi:hypothetical protein
MLKISAKSEQLSPLGLKGLSKGSVRVKLIGGCGSKNGDMRF